MSEIKQWKAIGLHDDATAEVGQTIRVKAVDENKLPIEWETASAQVDWDEVTNKPFVKVGGDTLTWDGNTEGLVSVDLTAMNGLVYYKVSDAVLTMDNFANGVTIVFDDGISATFTADGVMAIYDGVISNDALTFFAITEEAAGVDNDGAVFPESGVYFMVAEDETGSTRVSSLTIPGYTGFAKERIDPKVLPEALQFGKTTVQGDTLEWDGDITGKYSVDFIGTGRFHYLISTAIPSMEELSNGGTINKFVVNADGEIIESIIESITFATSSYGYIYDDSSYIVIVPEDGLVIYGDVVVEKAGVYIFHSIYENMCIYANKFTIPNYTGFTKTEIKPIEEKFIPDIIARKEDIQEQLDTIVVVSDTEPTDPDVTLWINTSEDSAEASAVEAHNTDENSHADIRAAIPTTPADLGLTTEALTFYYEDGTSRVVEVYVK